MKSTGRRLKQFPVGGRVIEMAKKNEGNDVLALKVVSRCYALIRQCISLTFFLNLTLC